MISVLTGIDCTDLLPVCSTVHTLYQLFYNLYSVVSWFYPKKIIIFFDAGSGGSSFVDVVVLFFGWDGNGGGGGLFVCCWGGGGGVVVGVFVFVLWFFLLR